MAPITAGDIQKFIGQINAVTDAGGTTTKDFDRILDRWQADAGQARGAQEQLNAAILGKETQERIAELNALALAELASTVDEYTVRNAAAAAVYPELVKEYAKVAAANYRTLADKF